MLAELTIPDVRKLNGKGGIPIMNSVCKLTNNLIILR